MNLTDFGFILFVFLLSLIGVTVCIFAFSVVMAEEETISLEITSDDILILEDGFYVIGPDGTKIRIEPSGGRMFDFTEQSKVYVVFHRYNPFFVYSGTDWEVDGIIKVDAE